MTTLLFGVAFWWIVARDRMIMGENNRLGGGFIILFFIAIVYIFLRGMTELKRNEAVRVVFEALSSAKEKPKPTAS